GVGQPVCRGGCQRFPKRVERAGADVAIDDANRAQHQGPESGPTMRERFGRARIDGSWTARNGACWHVGSVQPRAGPAGGLPIAWEGREETRRYPPRIRPARNYFGLAAHRAGRTLYSRIA